MPLSGAPPWVQVAPEAASRASLVGTASPGSCPEAEFAAWLYGGCFAELVGIEVRRFDLEREWRELERRLRNRRWYSGLGDRSRSLPLFEAEPPLDCTASVPEALADLIPGRLAPDSIGILSEAGISVGQGLRTGCNGFFYVTAQGAAGPGMITVETSPLFGSCQLSVPEVTLIPALRRQSELAQVEQGQVPDGRVFDLRSWVLPEDLRTVVKASAAYVAYGESVPQPMPKELAEHVRRAAVTLAPNGKLIPELSAVRTNVRRPAKGLFRPRYWYMLPNFAPRHFPAAFVPRVIHGRPRATANLTTRLCVDANFSTLWAPNGDWTAHALKALLNSVWCRAVMEALGTPMGGGALKLEATQLRHLPVPVLSRTARARLDAIGREPFETPTVALSRADAIVLGALCAQMENLPPLAELADAIERRARDLATARQRPGL